VSLKTAEKIIRGSIRLVCCDPRSMRFAGQWLRSMLGGHTPLGDQVPWVNFWAREWLESYLKPEMTVFEYGSGGSTVFVARRVRKLISVEHDPQWYRAVVEALAGHGILNCEYELVEPEPIPSGEMPQYGCRSYTSTTERYRGLTFEPYVRRIDRRTDDSLDLVLVDGRARASCVAQAMPKIRPGGYLMLDDAERPFYRDAIVLLAGRKQTDFVGIVPYLSRVRRTTVWQAPPR
jgi:hypothetical protein